MDVLAAFTPVSQHCDVGAADRLAALLAAQLRDTDRLLARRGQVLVLLVGAGADGASAVESRLGATATVDGVAVASCTIGGGMSAEAAFATLTTQPVL